MNKRAAVAATLAILLLGTMAMSAHAVPQNGYSFSYSETITVNNGKGSYSGYTDETQVSGNELETGASGGVVSAQYGLSFTYSSNQGASSSNSYSGPFTWSSENFTYVNGTDNQVGYSAPIFVWFAMDPAVPAGNPFFSLNTQMTVLSKNYSFQLPTENRYVQTIHVRGTGLYQRNDSYGVFSASYTWDEYFDPATGFIVGYNYVEQDNGQYQGQVGSFTYTDNLYVTTASYPLATASTPPPTTSGTGLPLGLSYTDLGYIALAAVVVVLALAYAGARSRRRKERLPEHSPTPSSIPPAPPSVPPPSVPPPQSWQSGVNLGSNPPEQVVIREVAKTNCRYCGTLIPTTADRCPYCGAPRQ